MTNLMEIEAAVSVYWAGDTSRVQPPSMKHILREVCEECDVTRDEILGERRLKRIVWPRHVAILLIYRNCKRATYAGIGRAMNRDHSTVMTAIRKAAARVDRSHPKFDPIFTDLYDRVRARL